MGRKSFKSISDNFFKEVVANFDFVVRDFDMTGPELSDGLSRSATFDNTDLRLRITLDELEMRVATKVWSRQDQGTLVADLSDLLSAAGMGSKNTAPGNVHSLADLRRVLRVNAEYFRELYPRLNSPEIVQLMNASNARLWPA